MIARPSLLQEKSARGERGKNLFWFRMLLLSQRLIVGFLPRRLHKTTTEKSNREMWSSNAKVSLAILVRYLENASLLLQFCRQVSFFFLGKGAEKAVKKELEEEGARISRPLARQERESWTFFSEKGRQL